MSGRSRSASSKSGSSSTGSSAPRRRAQCGWGRRRPPSRPRSSLGTPISSRATSSTGCAPQRRTRAERSRSPSRVSASSARRGSSTASSPSARTSSRTPSSPPGSHGTATSFPCEPPRHGSRPSPTTVAGTGSALQCSRSRRASTTSDARCSPHATSSRRRLTGIDDPVARNEAERASRCGRSRTRSTRRASRAPRHSTPSRERWLDRLLGNGARRRPRLGPHGVDPPALAARGDVHEGAQRPRLPRDAPGDGLRPRGREGHPAGPRGPAAEGAPRMRDPDRPAAARPPHHPRAGRPPRLRGVPPRGGARASLRGLRSRVAARVPAARARPRPHRDLLVPRSTRSRGSRAGTPSTSASSTGRHARTRMARSFSNAILFRRYSAKLGFELEFWGRFRDDGGTSGGYEERLTAATGIRYPAANHLADMDAGFYSADYLRAWIRAAQLRAHLRREVGEEWWRLEGTGRPPARAVPRGHPADDRGDRRPDRLRPPRHRSARRRARPPALEGGGAAQLLRDRGV